MEWLRHVEHDRGRKPTTIRGYQTLLRTHVLPEFGRTLLTDISTEHIERWVWDIDCSAATRAKLIVCLSGIYRRARRVWGITYNPVEDVERPQIRPTFEVNVYTPAEVLALVTAADNDQGRAVLLTAAFTGLRLGELVALRRRWATRFQERQGALGPAGATGHQRTAQASWRDKGSQ
jgi:integrase